MNLMWLVFVFNLKKKIIQIFQFYEAGGPFPQSVFWVRKGFRTGPFKGNKFSLN